MDRNFMILCLILNGFKEEQLFKLNDKQLYNLVHEFCFKEE